MDPNATGMEAEVVAQEEVAHQEKWMPASSLSRAEREVMKALSQAVFGRSSKWQDLIDKGAPVQVTRKIMVEEKQEDGSMKEVEKEVPVLLNGAPYSVMKRYTASELKGLMLDLQQRVQEMNDKLAQQQLDAAKAKTEKEQAVEIQESAGGSAI
jgi:hypothetical protein